MYAASTLPRSVHAHDEIAASFLVCVQLPSKLHCTKRAFTSHLHASEEYSCLLIFTHEDVVSLGDHFGVDS